MIPITVNRERILKEIREKEKTEEEDRRNKDEEEDTEGELEFIQPYLNTIKTVNPYPPRNSLPTKNFKDGLICFIYNSIIFY